MRPAGFLGHHPPRDKEHHRASPKCRREHAALFYFIFLGLAAATTALVYAIEHSNFGWALVAIREDEDAAEVVGVHTTEIKWTANALAAFLTGLVGGIYAQRVFYIEPTSTFTLDTSLNVVLMVVIGGAASWQGPLIGSSVVLPVTQFL